MPKVTFITDYTPKGQSPDIPTYKAGETYELEVSYAEKYVRRGYAVEVDEKAERERKKQERKSSQSAAPATAPVVTVEAASASTIADAGAPAADNSAVGANPT